jgi:hypothetical protein
VAAVLDLRRPASPQQRRPRREVISGIVPVHTSEGVMDLIGPDTGVEALVEFILRRLNAGSYHRPVDSDSDAELVADDAEAFQIAADGHNRHAWGLAFACRTTDLHPESVWTRLAMLRAGVQTRAFWARNGFCIEHSARWLTRAEVEHVRARANAGNPERCSHGAKVGGLCCHGDLQPADRTDAWTRHPHRAALELLMLDAIRDPNTGGFTVADLNAILAKLDKPKGMVTRDPRDASIYYHEAGWRHRLATQDEVSWKLFTGAVWVGDQPPVVINADSLANEAVETGDELKGLTADQIAKAVADETARRMAEA